MDHNENPTRMDQERVAEQILKWETFGLLEEKKSEKDLAEFCEGLLEKETSELAEKF